MERERMQMCCVPLRNFAFARNQKKFFYPPPIVYITKDFESELKVSQGFAKLLHSLVKVS